MRKDAKQKQSTGVFMQPFSLMNTVFTFSKSCFTSVRRLGLGEGRIAHLCRLLPTFLRFRGSSFRLHNETRHRELTSKRLIDWLIYLFFKPRLTKGYATHTHTLSEQAFRFPDHHPITDIGNYQPRQTGQGIGRQLLKTLWKLQR